MASSVDAEAAACVRRAMSSVRRPHAVFYILLRGSSDLETSTAEHACPSVADALTVPLDSDCCAILYCKVYVLPSLPICRSRRRRLFPDRCAFNSSCPSAIALRAKRKRKLRLFFYLGEARRQPVPGRA